MRTFGQFLAELGIPQVQPQNLLGGNVTAQVTPHGLTAYTGQMNQNYSGYLKELEGMWTQLPIQTVEQIMQLARQGHQAAAKINKV